MFVRPVRIHLPVCVLCVLHFAASPSEKKTDLLHSETLLAGGARSALHTLALGAISTGEGRARVFKDTRTCVLMILFVVSAHP